MQHFVDGDRMILENKLETYANHLGLCTWRIGASGRGPDNFILDFGLGRVRSW